MRPTVFAIPLLGILLVAGCAATLGDGVEASEMREVEAFDGVHVQNGIRAEVIVGEQRVLDVRADSNLLELIETTTGGGSLSIFTSAAVEPVIPPEVSFGSSRLTFMTARETGTVGLAHRIVAERFGAAASNGAALQVGGACRTLDAIASDDGHLDAQSLRCDDVQVDAQGGSVVEVTALRRVEVHASGESTVIVRGNPSEVVEFLTDGSTLTIVP